LEEMASLENRSVSNLIEVMADERWKRLAEQQGVASATRRGQPLNLLEAVRQVGNEAFQNVYKLARSGRRCARRAWSHRPCKRTNRKQTSKRARHAYAKTVAEAMDLKLDADNPADREKLRRAILGLVAGRKMPKRKRRG